MMTEDETDALARAEEFVRRALTAAAGTAPSEETVRTVARKVIRVTGLTNYYVRKDSKGDLAD